MKPSFVRHLTLASLMCVACNLEAHELSIIRSDFTNSGVDPDARGLVRTVFNPTNPKLRLDLSGLTAGSTYQFAVDGILEDSFVADSRGRVHLDFRISSPSGGKRALDFDPRGAVLSISDPNGEILSQVFSGEGESDDIRVDERTSLLRAETELRGRVELRYLEQKNKDRFIVHLLGLERGDYEMFVDGQSVGTFDLNRGRSTSRTFELGKNGHNDKNIGKGKGNLKKVALDFDPRGLVVDVVRDDAIIFSGEMLAQIPSLLPQVGESNLVLTSTGTDADATGTALLHLNEDGELSLTVQIGALPAGTYDVVIGGVLRGTITVTGLEPDGLAEVVFSTEPDANELLLDFDVLGETIEIRQGATVFLNGTLSETLTELPLPTTVETELPLLNQGSVETASAHITLTTNGTALEGVEIDLGGVPVGNYDFRVGTEIQGTVVVTDNDGVLSGELIFANDGVNQPLDFDPRGQTVTIEQAGVVLLSRPLSL
jgi:hypothetical protein